MSETTKQAQLNIIEAFWQIYADNPVFFRSRYGAGGRLLTALTNKTVSAM